jgi:cell division protein FtsB
MSWLKKKADPISERARALSAEIASLESEIQKLDSQLQSDSAQPRLRSTAFPSTVDLPAEAALIPESPAPRRPEEPIFEEVASNRLEARTELPALFRRIQNHFRGPSTTNPKLVSYLAAGGIQGLRPLRYEKRVARNRFIVFVVFLFLALLGVLTIFFRHR